MNQTINKVTYPNIKAEMGRKGWKNNNLRSLLDIGLTTMKNKLNGHSDWTSDELVKMAEAFNCSVDYLLGRTKD